ncbi:MAG: RluA family pseudouridine synthase [Planctomycetes bacterium]|nr:RluA family pseudouridine synthase [Planctomycetota bacterium]
MSAKEPSHSYTIPTDWRGRRLDKALAELDPESSRSRLSALIKAGEVSVDGQAITRPGTPLEGGEQVTWTVPEVPPSQDSGGAIIKDIPILYEDEWICIVNKPAGLLSHRNHAAQALAVPEWVEAKLGPLPVADQPLRPGVVHRLDRGTSGIMVLARTLEAMQGLIEAFAARQVEKRYVAICHGSPRFDSEWVEDPIERDPRHPERRRIAAPGEGKPAETLFEVVKRFGTAAALCHARPKTGRTHQLRVHLSSRGLPLVGDKVYRHRGALPEPLPEGTRIPLRPALHAAELSFTHPGTGEKVSFEAPLPPELQNLLDDLERLI